MKTHLDDDMMSAHITPADGNVFVDIGFSPEQAKSMLEDADDRIFKAQMAIQRPVLFLDFDDVLCLNKTCGGYDVMLALSQVHKGVAKVESFSALWHDVFEEEPKRLLRSLHDEFNPLYVLSTSWTTFMNRGAFVAVLNQTGMGFVADNLHEYWETIKSEPVALPWGGVEKPLRATEIGLWRKRHLTHDKWVALDDEHSGTGLAKWPVKADRKFIVLCKVDRGLTDVEYQRLHQAFVLRSK